MVRTRPLEGWGKQWDLGTLVAWAAPTNLLLSIVQLKLDDMSLHCVGYFYGIALNFLQKSLLKTFLYYLYV